jgi:hypothetical protein
MIRGYAAYRAGERDVAAHLLSYDLQVLNFLDARAMKRIGYWEELSGRPTKDELLAAGLTPAEAAMLLAANRDWAMQHRHTFAAIRGYYKPALHQVYTKLKHGYTLVDPMVSPIFVGPDDEDRVGRQLRSGPNFAVMHQLPDGRRSMHFLASDRAAIVDCIDMARTVLTFTLDLANCWLLEVEHPAARTIAFAQVVTAVAFKWMGDGFNGLYDFEATLDRLGGDLDG